jgi:polysaccharide pyruvyl transferase WcaK-like protein
MLMIANAPLGHFYQRLTAAFSIAFAKCKNVTLLNPVGPKSISFRGDACMSSFISAMSATLKAMRRKLGSQSPEALRPPEPTRRQLHSNSPTLLLLNDCRDQINYGSEALMEGLLHIITAAIPEHTLRLIPSHWLIEAGYPSAFHKGNSLVQPGESAIWPEVADQFECIADEWLAGRGGRGVDAYLAKLEGVDVVILNGEGSMYRTNISAVRELFIAWFAKTKLGIPTVFLNGLVQLTLIMPILPAMVRKTFRSLDAVAVRDPYSLRNLQEFMPEIPVRLFPDSALALPLEIDNPSPGVKAMFKELGNTDFFCFDPGPMPIDYRFGTRSSLYRVITEIKQVVAQAVMVVSGPPEAPLLKQVAADTDSVYLEEQPSYRDLMAVLARAKFQISGRNHNALLGARVGCPAISIGSISHKVHGACEQLGFSEPYDGTDLWSRIERIKAHAASHLAGGVTLRNEIRSTAARLAAESFEMGVMVKDILTKQSKRVVQTR